jgi:hypothetical protein
MGIIKCIGNWFKKNWLRLVAWIAAIGGALLLVRSAIAKMGKVVRSRGWIVDPNDEKHLLIEDAEGEYQYVTLPRGVRASRVTAAGVDDSNQWTVEVLHEATDRRGDPASGRVSDLGL